MESEAMSARAALEPWGHLKQGLPGSHTERRCISKWYKITGRTLTDQKRAIIHFGIVCVCVYSIVLFGFSEGPLLLTRTTLLKQGAWRKVGKKIRLESEAHHNASAGK